MSRQMYQWPWQSRHRSATREALGIRGAGGGHRIILAHRDGSRSDRRGLTTPVAPRQVAPHDERRHHLRGRRPAGTGWHRRRTRPGPGRALEDAITLSGPSWVAISARARHLEALVRARAGGNHRGV